MFIKKLFKIIYYYTDAPHKILSNYLCLLDNLFLRKILCLSNNFPELLFKNTDAPHKVYY